MNSDVCTRELDDLSALLWREREMLELLLFKLAEEQLILEADCIRWLPHAVRAVEMVIGEIRQIELERALAFDDALPEAAGDVDRTLATLVTMTDGPWPQIFDGHRVALSDLTGAIRKVAESNHHALARGHAATRRALDRNIDDASSSHTLDHRGRP